MEDGKAKELEEKVEMEVEQSEETVEPASEMETCGKLPTNVGCAEDWTWPGPCEWLGPLGRAILEILVGQLESKWIPGVW